MSAWFLDSELSTCSKLYLKQYSATINLMNTTINLMSLLPEVFAVCLMNHSAWLAHKLIHYQTMIKDPLLQPLHFEVILYNPIG